MTLLIDSPLTTLQFERKRVHCLSWCAAVVLSAVCSLTVSVATRYCFLNASHSAATAVHQPSTVEHGRQRLLKSSPAWHAPATSLAVFFAPTFYSRIAPARPPLINVVLEESLYNRPPPFSKTLS